MEQFLEHIEKVRSFDLNRFFTYCKNLDVEMKKHIVPFDHYYSLPAYLSDKTKYVLLYYFDNGNVKQIHYSERPAQMLNKSLGYLLSLDNPHISAMVIDKPKYLYEQMMTLYIYNDINPGMLYRKDNLIYIKERNLSDYLSNYGIRTNGQVKKFLNEHPNFFYYEKDGFGIYLKKEIDLCFHYNN